MRPTCSLLLLALVALSYAAQWQEVNGNQFPSPRYQQATAVVNGILYLFGGDTYDTQYEPNGELWMFQGQVWQQLQPAGNAPAARGYATFTAGPNGTLILFGGKTEPPMEKYFNDTWIFDTISRTWTEVTPQNANASWPCQRFFHTATNVKGDVYVFGGTASGFNPTLNDLWVFRTATNTWQQLQANSTKASVPSTRQAASAVAYKDGLLLFGGRSGVDRSTYSDMWYLDVKGANGTWTQLHFRGAPQRASHSAAVMKDTMWVFGGVVLQSVGEQLFNDLWTFNFTTSAWKQASDGSGNVPWRRFGQSANTLNGQMIIFGGYGLYQGLKNDTWALSP